MSQRSALLVAAALAAAVMVLIGGLAGRLAPAPAGLPTAPDLPAPTQAPPPVRATADQDTLVGAAQATRAAVAYRGDGEVVKVELDDEDGGLVYAVKFGDGSKIYVDAAGGQVVYATIKDDGQGD